MDAPLVDTAPPADPPINEPVRGDGRPTRWVRKRGPVLIAVAVIAALLLALIGLRAWGPMNPDVRVSYQPPDGFANTTARVVLDNNARAGVEVTDVRIVPNPLNHGFDGVLPTAGATAVHPLGDASQSYPVPYDLAGNTSVAIDVELRANGCLPPAGLLPFVVEVDYRTMSGRVVSVHDASPVMPPPQNCPPGSLPTGE